MRPRSRLSRANRVTDHLGVAFAGAGAPRRLAAAVGTAGLCQRRGSRRRAETTGVGLWGPLTAPPPDAPGGAAAAAPALPTPRVPATQAPARSKCLPHAGRQGGRGSSFQMRRGAGKKDGLGAARGARPAAAAPAASGRRDRGERPGGPSARGAVRSALAPASPAEKGGTAGAPARQTARAAAGWAATASQAPGKPPPAPPQSGWGEELTVLWSPTRGAPDAGSRPPRGCKVAGSAPRALSLLTLRWGTGQVAGVSGGGSGQLPSSHLGAGEWGPGGGGDGSWASPRHPALPRAPPTLPSLLGAALWPPRSASWTCSPPQPSPTSFLWSGLGLPA